MKCLRHDKQISAEKGNACDDYYVPFRLDDVEVPIFMRIIALEKTCGMCGWNRELRIALRKDSRSKKIRFQVDLPLLNAIR